MSFSFGTPTTNAGLGGAAAAPATGSFSFGARPATTAPPPAFGAATAAVPSLAGTAGAVVGAAAPTFNFAATTVAAAPTLSFGSPATAAVAPTGTGLSLPAFGSTAAAPTFGAPAAAAPAFGAAAATPAFGAPAATPAFGAPATAPAFGAPAAAPAFGAPAAAPAFGAPAAAPAFGATTAVPAFGAATSAAPAFGTTATAAAPAFGATAAPAFGATTATPAFGAATATVAPTFSFATPATSAPTTAPPAFGSTLGGGGAFSFSKPAVTTAASLNFNTTTTTATAQPFNSGLRLGGNNTLAPATTGIGGVLGKPLGTGTAAPTAFIGLGGIDVSSTQPKLGDKKQDGIKIKETQVPEEIVKTVDALKSYIKQQKTISSEIGRTSTSKLSNVSHEITNLRWTLQNVANSVDANNGQIKQLRSETAKAISSLEMAQRTQDTPAGLQFENSAPFQYFQCLVAKYEKDLISFRQQIMLTESHMHALAHPQTISPEDMKRCFRQMNESFVSLAGRLHELHKRVEEQKELYLRLRRYRLRDATNVFAHIENPQTALLEPQRISTGPTPFSNISAALNKSYMSAATSGNTSDFKA